MMVGVPEAGTQVIRQVGKAAAGGAGSAITITGVLTALGSVASGMDGNLQSPAALAKKYAVAILTFSGTVILGAPEKSESAFCETIREISQEDSENKTECDSASDKLSRQACMIQNAASQIAPLHSKKEEERFKLNLESGEKLSRLYLIEGLHTLVNQESTQEVYLDNGATYAVKHADGRNSVISIDSNGHYHECHMGPDIEH